MDILDNLAVISQRDSFDALGVASGTLEQLKHSFDITLQQGPEIKNIVFAGMGGSALQAELVRTWPRLTVPFIISRAYEVPDFVDAHTLVVISSYSGNTEESISSLHDARSKNARIIVMAGGGKLQGLAADGQEPFVLLPKAVQPRMAIFYAFRALLEVFVALQLAPGETIAELEASADRVRPFVGQWQKEVPTSDNIAKQLALKLVGKTPIYYGGPLMAPAAYKWKINTNENAKNTAWYNLLPEFDHNEFMGWTSHPVEKPFAIVDLMSSYEHERVTERFSVGDRMLSGMRPKAIPVQAEGKTALDHLLYLTVLGDFVTIYLGLLNGLDPSPVALIEKFKTELGEYDMNHLTGAKE
jgi:glucose/mannose-6-phosphate isomerase